MVSIHAARRLAVGRAVLLPLSLAPLLLMALLPPLL